MLINTICYCFFLNLDTTKSMYNVHFSLNPKVCNSSLCILFFWLVGQVSNIQQNCQELKCLTFEWWSKNMSIQSSIIHHFKKTKIRNMKKCLWYNVKWKILKTKQKLFHAVTWMTFENMLSERIKTQTTVSGNSPEKQNLFMFIFTHYMISFIWKVQNR